MAVSGPTRARRKLGKRLRVLREAAGLKNTQIPVSIMSKTKLDKIEAGRQNAKLPDVWALCRIYGVTNADVIESLVKLAEAGAEKEWWEDYKDIVPEHLGLYVTYEEDAAGITFWHPEVVFGLLQTPEYARAVISADDPAASEEEVQRRVSFRMQRQSRVLDRVDPPEIIVMQGAAALHLEVGSAHALADQRQHLLDLSQRPNIDVRVIPWSAGAHAGLRGSFTVLDYNDEDAPTTVVTESHAGARYMETAEDVSVFRRITERMLDATIPIKEYLA